MPKTTTSGLKKITFDISIGLHGAKEQVKGYELKPGLALHCSNGAWRLSHTVSGLGLVLGEIDGFDTRKEAFAYARTLIKCFPDVDWTVEGGELRGEVTKGVLGYNGGVMPRCGPYKAMRDILYDLVIKEKTPPKKSGVSKRTRKKKPARKPA